MGDCQSTLNENSSNAKELVKSDTDLKEDINNIVTYNEFEQIHHVPFKLRLSHGQIPENEIQKDITQFEQDGVLNEQELLAQMPSSLLYREIIMSDKDAITSSLFYKEIIMTDQDDKTLGSQEDILQYSSPPSPQQHLIVLQPGNEVEEFQSYMTSTGSQNQYGNQHKYPKTDEHWLPKKYNKTVSICLNSCSLIQNNLEMLDICSPLKQTPKKQQLKYDFLQESHHGINQLKDQEMQKETNFFKLSKIIFENTSSKVKHFFRQPNEKQQLLDQLDQEFKIEKQGTILYFQGLSNEKDGNLIFCSDQQFQCEIFQISCEEIIQLWNKRAKIQKVLLFLLDSQYTWQWIEKIKAQNDLTIFIQTIKGLDVNLPKNEQIFNHGEFSENLTKVLNNNHLKLINNQQIKPLFFAYNNPYRLYEIIGLPIFFFCFSQMVYFKDKMNIIKYEQDDELPDPDSIKKSDISSNFGSNFVEEIQQYIGFINQDGICSKFGSAVYKNKDIYLGEWQNEEKCGLGILFYYQEGQLRIYFGQFNQNLFQGEGLLIFGDGSYYLGNFDLDRQNQRGAIYYSNGESYIGDFLNDQRHGYGEQKMINGRTYKGEFQNDLKNGKGIIESNEGMIIYNGTFVDGLKQGYGKEVYDSEGKIFYDGEWKFNSKNGFGKEWYSNGAYFEGLFVDNLKEDIGKYVYSNGCVFQGKFHLDMRNGVGVFNDVNGLRYEGMWINNQEEGQFKVYKDDRLHQQLLYIKGIPYKQIVKRCKTLVFPPIG